ncbi:MAG TPA: NAD(P)-dependent oxidoreductase [Nitrospiraceae bacterium]|nr:NAD(P)-dependent oxidoreductase [Nitrospiraceae bacterium]
MNDRRILRYYELLRYQPESLALLHARFKVMSAATPDDDRPGDLKDIDVVIAPLGYFWGQEKIDQAPRLKVIASNTTGVPHIDVAYAETRGIRVVSLKNETAFLQSITPTAEMTWALILGVTRRVPWSFQAVCGGEWERRNFGGKTMLSRMVLGIVGLGRLGTMVAGIARGFGMTVRYYDPDVTADRDGATKVLSLDELLSASDIVTVHIPMEPKNIRLFDAARFAQFKRGAYFINTSRGEVVDSQALREALLSGNLAGAGLDVLDGEYAPDFKSLVSEHPLVDYAKTHDNLLITPHTGGSTIDAWRETELHTIRLAMQALSGMT